MTLSSLIKRLEEAEGPSRELDVAVCWALDLEPWAGTEEALLAFFAKGSKMDKQTPALTGSVDAAISLAERVVAKEGRKLICFFCAGGQLTPYNAEEGSPDYHPKAKIDNSVTVGWMAHVAFYNDDGTTNGPESYSHGRTAPLAILLATLRTLQSKGEQP